MWSISVEPIPSRIVDADRACQRASTAAGSASAADTHARTPRERAVRAPGSRTIAAYSAGTEKNSVGR